MTVPAKVIWGLLLGSALFYLVFRQATLEARLDALGQSVSRLEQSLPPTLPVDAADRVLSGLPAAEGAKVHVAATPAAAPEVARLEQELQRLREQLSEAPLSEKKILDVVETKREAVFAKQMEFHRQRWMESRADALDQFTANANLSPSQRSKVDDLLTEEVDRVMELLLDPAVRDEPEQLVEAWDAALNRTDFEIRKILVPFQREKWEEARAYERSVFFPFLPK